MKNNMILLKHAAKNSDYFCSNPKFMAQIIEHVSAEEDGDIIINATGYDHYNEKTKKKTEVKSTNYIKPTKELRIKGLKNKFNKCDFIKIYDYSLGWTKRRVFKVPSKVFFTKAKLVCDGDEFFWSSSYNFKDNIQVNNTQFLLNYEI